MDEASIAVVRDQLEDLGAGTNVRELVSRVLRLTEAQAGWMMDAALGEPTQAQEGFSPERLQLQFDVCRVVAPHLAEAAIDYDHDRALWEDGLSVHVPGIGVFRPAGRVTGNAYLASPAELRDRGVTFVSGLESRYPRVSAPPATLEQGVTYAAGLPKLPPLKKRR